MAQRCDDALLVEAMATVKLSPCGQQRLLAQADGALSTWWTFGRRSCQDVGDDFFKRGTTLSPSPVYVQEPKLNEAKEQDDHRNASCRRQAFATDLAHKRPMLRSLLLTSSGHVRLYQEADEDASYTHGHQAWDQDNHAYWNSSDRDAVRKKPVSQELTPRRSYLIPEDEPTIDSTPNLEAEAQDVN